MQVRLYYDNVENPRRVDIDLYFDHFSCYYCYDSEESQLLVSKLRKEIYYQRPLYRKHLHREDGPAVEAPFLKEWYKNGKLHRLNGPAIEEDYKEEFYVNGQCISKLKYNKIRNIKTKEDLILLLLGNNKNIRLLAEYRLKELESDK